MLKNKIVLLLVSLVIAGMAWIYVVTTVAPESTKTISGISVSVVGDTVLEGRGLMITDFGSEPVRVVLEASRASLSKLNSSNVQASLDASRITEAGEYDLSYSIVFPETVNSGEISIREKSVNTIHVTVSQISTVTLDVMLDWSGQLKDGFLFNADAVRFDPATVTLRGPSYEVDRVKTAVVFYDITDVIDVNITSNPLLFLDEQGEAVELSELTSCSVTNVTTELSVLRIKEITLLVELKYGPGINAGNVNVTFSPTSVEVSGLSDVIEALSNSLTDDTMTVGTIDLTTVKDGDVLEFPINVPSGTNNISGETKVVATVTFNGLETRSYTVYDIQMINEPEDYETTLSTRAVNVQLRGSASILQGISAEDIHITVDLSDFSQSGSYTVPAEVTIDSNPDVGILGVVEVIVSLS